MSEQDERLDEVSEADGNLTAAAETVSEPTENTAAAKDGEMKEVSDISKQKKRNRWGFLLTIVLFACVVYTLRTISNAMGEGDTTTFVELLKVVKWKYILIALAVMFAMMLCDVLKFSTILRTNGLHIGIKNELALGLTGKYYSAITPTSTGGQPMQIYYLCKHGVSGANSSSVALMGYAVQMFASAVVSAIVMGVCVGYLSAIDNGTIRNALLVSGWIGFGINACAPVFIAIIILKPSFLKWLVNLGFVLLGKLHILKKVDERRQKAFKGIDDFAVCSKFIMTHPLKFLQAFLFACAEPICVSVFPYLVMLAFCGDSVTNSPELFLTVAAMATYSTYAVVYIPTPGNSGAYETMFMLAFASINSEIMFWVAIVSRFFNYYVYIIFGLCMNATDIITAFVKKRKTKKRENIDAA